MSNDLLAYTMNEREGLHFVFLSDLIYEKSRHYRMLRRCTYVVVSTSKRYRAPGMSASLR
jgi:predicted nicotinamide N-methyase